MRCFEGIDNDEDMSKVGRDVFQGGDVSDVDSDGRRDQTSRHLLFDDCEYSECSSNGEASGKSIIFQAPFTVIAPPLIQTTSPPPSQPKIRIGTINAINHPTPHPIAIPATTQIEIEPSRVSVCRTNCGWGGTNNNDVRTVPLEDSGRKCCRLTIVGGRVMYPGDKVLLHFDFLEKEEEDRHHHNDGGADEIRPLLLRCYQVSACLYGEEKAIGIDGKTKRRTRYNVFDTSTAEVEHGYTDSVSLTLALPLDNCPVTLETDLVEATVTCRIDVTVSDESPTLRASGSTVRKDDTGGDTAASNVIAYRFLTVEFLCCVMRCALEDQEDTEGGEGLVPGVQSKIVQLLTSGGGGDNEDGCRKKVLNPDVLNDLTMLSLHTIETGVQ